MTQKRACITGLGIIAPIGCGIEKFWTAALAGTNGIRPITSFDTSDFKTKVGGEVLDFNPTDFLAQGEIARMGRASQFAVAATRMALADAGLVLESEDSSRIAVCMGTTMGEPQILEQGIMAKYNNNNLEDAISPLLPRQYPCSVIPANVARSCNIKGQVIIIPTACAAGNYAIGYAFDLIRMGRADVVIAGGADPLSRIAFTGFNRLLATADTACRPFDKNREGMAVSEGAGVLIIESEEHAQRRNAPIYAEILGYGLGCDAHKMTIPDPEGLGGILAFQKALSASNIAPTDIDYVSAHGTGTGENDKCETMILKKVLGDHAYKVAISSLKSMIGHTMGAASAIEACASALMIKHQTALPTINYETPDPDCDLDYVPNVSRAIKINTIVSNAYAFGGNTSAIVLRRYVRS